MLFETSGQAVVFLMTVYGGLLMGLCYDVFRMLRTLLVRLSPLLDIILALIFTFIAAFILLRAADGVLRLYMALGFVCGATLYFGGLSPLVMGIFYRLRRAFQRFRKWLMERGVVQRLLK